MAQKPETKFRVSKVLPFLKKLKNTESFSIQQMSIGGDPDFILSCYGTLIGMELKADNGILRPLQAYKLGRIRDTGNVAFVARPATWELAKHLLSQFDQGEYYGIPKILGNFELSI